VRWAVSFKPVLWHPGPARGFFLTPSLKFAPTGSRTQDLEGAAGVTSISQLTNWTSHPLAYHQFIYVESTCSVLLLGRLCDLLLLESNTLIKIDGSTT